MKVLRIFSKPPETPLTWMLLQSIILAGPRDAFGARTAFAFRASSVLSSEQKTLVNLAHKGKEAFLSGLMRPQTPELLDCYLDLIRREKWPTPESDQLHYWPVFQEACLAGKPHFAVRVMRSGLDLVKKIVYEMPPLLANVAQRGDSLGLRFLLRQNVDCSTVPATNPMNAALSGAYIQLCQSKRPTQEAQRLFGEKDLLPYQMAKFLTCLDVMAKKDFHFRSRTETPYSYMAFELDYRVELMAGRLLEAGFPDFLPYVERDIPNARALYDDWKKEVQFRFLHPGKAEKHPHLRLVSSRLKPLTP